MESCCPALKLNPCSSPFGLNKNVVSPRVSAFWGAQIVKANHLRTQKLRSGHQKIQPNLIRSVLTPFVDQESHVSIIYTCDSKKNIMKIWLCYSVDFSLCYALK